MHGGGNFGDLWEGYWQNRVKLLGAFRNRKIVQLPQSIHFSDSGGEALEATRRAIGEHPDFTLMLRDLPSYEFANQHFDCRVLLVPDMAFGLRSLEQPVPPVAPIFALMRGDRERMDDGSGARMLQGRALVDDWVGKAIQRTINERIILKIYKRWPGLRSHIMNGISAIYKRHCEANLTRGISALGQGEVVITDRLHGHIICTLMGKPHVVLDNSYQKITNYIQAWPGNDLVHMADSIPHALTLAEDILAGAESS